MKLQNKTILITGGSSGIGLALAKRLTPTNTVIICGRSQQKLDDAKRSIPHVHTFRCDVASPEERSELYTFLNTNFPSLNVLINNAAIVHKTSFADDEEIVAKAKAEIHTNLLAPIALSKWFLSSFSQPFSIVNISTGLVYAPRAVYPIYNATKAALHSFTQVLRHQLREAKIEVIEVMMPAVDTPWHQGSAPKIAISAEQAANEMIKNIESGKIEIRVGAVKILRLISRLSPALAFRIINRVQ